MTASALADGTVALEPASEASVDLLVRWTLDPVAQGPYKRVPNASAADLRARFLAGGTRAYFLIRAAGDRRPLGRFYWHAWRFDGPSARVDWELNVLIAEPHERGRGAGTAAQRLAAEHLLARPETASVFAYTDPANAAEQRALAKAGFTLAGRLPFARYPIPEAEGFVLFARAARVAS